MNTVSIKNGGLFLKWDGVIPETAPQDSVFKPEDVLLHWPYIRDYAKWSKRDCAFKLAFSKQNVERLKAQFGPISITHGTDQYKRLKQVCEMMHDLTQKADMVRQLPVERLPQYPYKMQPLGDFQHRGVVFLRNVKRAPLFADCGVGKTFMALVSTELQIKYGEIPPGKTLICGKLSTLETGWVDDMLQFTDLTAQVLWAPSGKRRRKEFILEKLEQPADIYIINHNGLLLFEDELVAKNFKKIIVDESTILKGFRSMSPQARKGQMAKALMRIAHSADWRVIMSGTPAPNGPEDLWGQMAFLDPAGIFLEAAFKDFQRTYYKEVDLRPANKRYVFDRRTNKPMLDMDGKPILKPLKYNDPKKHVPKKGAIEEVGRLVGRLSYRVRIRDHIKDLPDITLSRRRLDMTKEQDKHYEDMKKRLMVEIDETRITVPMQLAKLGKLRQITGGFIIDNESNPIPMTKTPKLDELDSLINDEINVDNKIVIFAEYQWEIKTIEQRYKKHGLVSVYGGNSTKKNLENIRKFKEDPKARIVVAHPQSCAHGVTWTCAHYLIFYSYSHSEENNYQAIKRIERNGQKNAMFVYYLSCKGTIDDDMYAVLKLKSDNQKRMIDHDEMLKIQQHELDKKLLTLWRNGVKE